MMRGARGEAASSAPGTKTSNTSEASLAVRAMIPTVSKVGASIATPAVGIAPKLGLNPTTPLYAAGRSVEPPVCVPNANGI